MTYVCYLTFLCLQFDGERDINVAFSSKQIGGFTGHAFVTIRRHNYLY